MRERERRALLLLLLLLNQHVNDPPFLFAYFRAALWWCVQAGLKTAKITGLRLGIVLLANEWGMRDGRERANGTALVGHGSGLRLSRVSFLL